MIVGDRWEGFGMTEFSDEWFKSFGRFERREASRGPP
jgi:hypothetical protein